MENTPNMPRLTLQRTVPLGTRTRSGIKRILKQLIIIIRKEVLELIRPSNGNYGNTEMRVTLVTRRKRLNVKNRITIVRLQTELTKFWFQAHRKKFYREILGSLKQLSYRDLVLAKFVRLKASKFQKFSRLPKARLHDFDLDPSEIEKAIPVIERRTQMVDDLYSKFYMYFPQEPIEKVILEEPFTIFEDSPPSKIRLVTGDRNEDDKKSSSRIDYFRPVCVNRLRQTKIEEFFKPISYYRNMQNNLES